jgi:cysteine desulfurase
MKKRIYLDHAAATPVDSRVQLAMVEAMAVVGNPSAYNDAGRQAAEILEKSRAIIARFLHARPEEIVFTGSGSEANVLALTSAHSRKIITTPIEHKSILENIDHPVFVKVDAEGRVNMRDLEKKLTSKIGLVSIMYANNEIGTLEPVAHIGKLIRRFRAAHKSDFPLFHVDACQAAEYASMNVQELGVDLLTFNGSKVYGPRGIGVLYVRRGVRLIPFVRGGNQEFGLRAGTENVPAAAGLALAVQNISSAAAKLSTLRDNLIKRLSQVLPDALLNGPTGSERLPNNIHISIPGIESENLLLELDAQGISAGSGSACTARSVEPSHVLKAVGVKSQYLSGALRISLGRTTTKKDLEFLLKVLPKIVEKLRRRYS